MAQPLSPQLRSALPLMHLCPMVMLPVLVGALHRAEQAIPSGKLHRSADATVQADGELIIRDDVVAGASAYVAPVLGSASEGATRAPTHAT